MSQLFGPRSNTIARCVLAAIAVTPFLFIFLAYQLLGSPYGTGQSLRPEQPVPFSHKHHIGGLGIDCRYCHTGVEQSAFAGMPPTSTCMTCHSELWTNAAMLAPVRNSLATSTPIRWNRVYKLPDYVYFDHSVHVRNGIGCSSCHGDVATMPLTVKATPLTMQWCLSCHRDPARHLRPPDQIFNPHWREPADQTEEERRLLAFYHINTAHLTDCSVCHR
jgi:hypothetical protein